MSVIDSINNSLEFLETESTTEMKSYSFFWKPSFFSLQSHEISVLLPLDTEYSRGAISTKTLNGYETKQDFVDGSSGIPVPRSGKANLSVSTKNLQINGNTITTYKVTQMATVSFSLLENGVSKNDYLNSLKQNNVKVLYNDEDSLIRISRSDFYSDVIEKTIIRDNLIFQIYSDVYRSFHGPQQPIIEIPIYEAFEKIRLTPSSS